jgi:protease-4
MGDAAASGGYWIAAAADEIVADPGTITGSIGVASLIPTFDRSLDKLGVGTGGASTTWLAAVGTPLQPLDKRVAQMADARIGSTYGKFLQAVAEGRSTTPEKIDAVAQGRVWTGRQAAQRGLVDTLGGLQDALASAARRAQLDDDYRVAYLERERRPIDRWIELLLSRVVAATNLGSMWDAGLPGVAAGVLPQFELGVRLLEQSRLDPLTVHAHCFCNAP